jgi:GNAT superfamily N-acetyltransferase
MGRREFVFGEQGRRSWRSLDADCITGVCRKLSSDADFAACDEDVFYGKNTECYLAYVDGRLAGGATVAIRGRIAGLFGASTLPDFRRQGVQTALLIARLRRAAEEGCDLAVSLAAPGSVSQRNIIRHGFRVLYTRVKFERVGADGRSA